MDNQSCKTCTHTIDNTTPLTGAKYFGYTVGISNVNSTVLANRANIGFSEKESKDED